MGILSRENFKDGKYPSLVGLAFIFNLVVGTGSLALPLAVSQSGWVLSVIMITILAVCSFITVTFIIEVMALVNARQAILARKVGLIFVFNLVVGTGVLTLPKAFSLAGWVLGSFLVIILGVAGYVTVTFTVEAMACASFIYLKKYGNELQQTNQRESTSTDASKKEITPSDDFNLDIKIELSLIAKYLFGQVGRSLFYGIISIYLFGDLGIYLTALSNSLITVTCQTNLTVEDYSGLCWESYDISKIGVYRLYCVLFTLVLGPFAYFNVQKTMYLQIITIFIRWTTYTGMIISSLHRICTMGQQGFPGVFKIQGFPTLVGSSIYSFMCHHSLPGIICPFKYKDKLMLKLMFDYILIFSFYIILSLTGAFAFANPQSLLSLNFVAESTGGIASVLNYYLTAFPIFVISTSYPIVSTTLQNNLKFLTLDETKMSEYHFVVRRLVFPTVTLILPLLIAFFTYGKNLTILVWVTGSYIGIVIQYIFPTLLVYFARKEVSQYVDITLNPHQTPFKHFAWLIVILIWSGVCIILITINLIVENTK